MILPSACLLPILREGLDQMTFSSGVKTVSLGHTGARGIHLFWQCRLENESQCRQKYYQALI